MLFKYFYRLVVMLGYEYCSESNDDGTFPAQNSLSNPFKNPFLFRKSTSALLRYLYTTSPFVSPPNSQGSISTTSLSRTHNSRRNRPGMRQIRSLLSRHKTRIRLPPKRCCTMPRISLPRGIRTRMNCSSVSGSGMIRLILKLIYKHLSRVCAYCQFGQ